MGLETRERTINGHIYSVTQLGAKRATKLLRRVTQVLAPALGDAVGPALAASKGKGLAGLANMDLSMLGPALERLFAQLDDAALDAIVFDADNGALSTCRYEGRPFVPMIDAVLGADLLTLGKVVAFALEVHFASFFDAFAAAKPKVEASPSPA